MRDHILAEIRRLADANGGQPPGYKLFLSETGISEHHWRGKFWARWSDALTDAGYAPNKWQGRLDSNEVLTGVIAACRHYGRFPTQPEIQLFRKTQPAMASEQAIKRHFGRRADLIDALSKKVSGDDQYADIAAMLPAVLSSAKPPPRAPQTKSPDGWVYLFKSGDFYKIGRSDDLERRMKEVGVKLPEKLTPIHSIRTDDPPGIEAYWHRRFADRRANGEWFKLSSLSTSPPSKGGNINEPRHSLFH